MKDNRGLSLIEVIITLAIMSLVLLSALQLILSGTRMYTKTSTSVDVQTEAQLLESQLNNLIVDAECGVYAKSGDGITDEESGFVSDGYIKVFNYSVVYYIAWDQASQKVFYLEKAVVDGSVEALTDDEKNITNWSLMGEGVSSFVPDTSHVTENQRLVVVSLEVTKGNGHYETVQNILLRNNVLQSNNLSEIYEGNEIAGKVTITEVIVSSDSQSVVAVNRGQSRQFQALVKANNGTPSQDVVWTVSGAGSGATTISHDGVLFIAADEDAAVINVIATAKDSIVFGKATVIVPTVRSVSVSVNNDSPAPGNSIICTAVVSGDNLDDSAKQVSWSVEAGGLDVTINERGILTVGTGVPAGSDIIIKATAIVTDAAGLTQVSGTYRVTVSSKEVNGFTITSDTTTLNRNGSIQFTANLDGVDLIGKDKKVEWSIVNDAGLGDKVSISQNGLLTASKDINYGKSYTVTIMARTTSEALAKTYEATVTVEIKTVMITFDSSAASVVKGQTVRFPYTITGLENVGEDISVTSSPSVSYLTGTFMYCNNSELIVTVGKGLNRNSITVTVSLKGGSTIKQSVVVNIREQANVEGTSLYIPSPSDAEAFPSADAFRDENGNLRAVEVYQADKILTYFISVENGQNIYHLYVDNKEYIYQDEMWKAVR